MTSFLLMLGALGVAAWLATDALALMYPHLTPRQRWAVMYLLTAAAGCVHTAIRFGS